MSPITHTRGGLTPVQALDIIIASKVCIENELAKKPVSPLHPSLGKIRVGIIVYVSTHMLSGKLLILYIGVMW